MPAYASSRLGSFNEGINGGEMSSSMQSPTGVAINSVLQNYQLSANGSSSADAARKTPSGYLPSQNGMSPSTYAVKYPSIGTSLGY